MSFDAGTRLGPYEILAPLGAGGMGEVYKAQPMTPPALGRLVRTCLKKNPDNRRGAQPASAWPGRLTIERFGEGE